MYKPKLYTILGICIIMFITYRTLILKREPYKINETVGFYVRVVVVCIMLWVLYKTLKEIMELKSKENSWLQKMSNILYFKPLKSVGEILLKRKKFQEYIKGCGGMVHSKRALLCICSNNVNFNHTQDYCKYHLNSRRFIITENESILRDFMVDGISLFI